MKIRTDFVTNSSSSSFCIELDVTSTKGKEYKLKVDPHNVGESGADSSIWLKEDLRDVFIVRDIHVLCDSLIHLINLDNDIEITLEKKPEEAEEAGLCLKDIVMLDDNMQKLTIMSKISGGYKKLTADCKKFAVLLEKELDSVNDVNSIEYREINSAWGEFADENFGRVIGELIDIEDYFLYIYNDSAYIYDGPGMLRELRKKIGLKCDYEDFIKVLSYGNCDSYELVKSYILNLKDESIKKSEYIERCDTSGWRCPPLDKLFGYNLCFDPEKYEETGDFVVCDDVLIEYKGHEEKIVIPEGIKYIGNSVFRSCKDMVSVSLPNSLTYIGDAAFYECYNLKRINLPRNLKHIKSKAFYNCELLKRIIFHEGLIDIGHEAFSGCLSLEKIVLKDGLRRVEARAFYDCACLEEVIFPESIEKVGKQAFGSSPCLKRVVISNSCAKISDDAVDDVSVFANL